MRVGDAGWFGPGSATWRINGETAMLLGGGRALILQVAHPLVGAGVEHYSRFATDRWNRLTHTLDTMGKILFGDSATAQRGADRMRRAHARIHGVVANGRAAGQPYDATDPELVLWVWATLVDTSMLVYDRFVRRLTDDERTRYYAEQHRFAHACGVPANACPPTYAAFAVYFERIVRETLEPTTAAQHVAGLVLNPFDLPRAAAPLLSMMRLPTVGLLPERMRQQLGLDWTAGHELALRTTALASRRTVPMLPDRLRRVRSAREAASRCGLFSDGAPPCVRERDSSRVANDQYQAMAETSHRSSKSVARRSASGGLTGLAER